jgi:hypothetical protein
VRIDLCNTFGQTRYKWIVTAVYVSFALCTPISTIQTYGTTIASAVRETLPTGTMSTVIAMSSVAVYALVVLEKKPWCCLCACFPVLSVRSVLQ